jgi:uridine kinase
LPTEKIASAIERWRQSGSQRPFFIGMGGGSASGKSTLAAQMVARLKSLRVKVIGQDRFFKKPEEMPQYYSQLNDDYRPAYNEPDSLKIEEMFAGCRALKNAAADVVILEGILVLFFAELRELMDLQLYIKADADERIIRRIRRNMKTLDDYDHITHYYLESVRGQHEEYNAPTEKYADIVIAGGMAETEERERVVEVLCAALEKHLVYL